MGVGRPHKSLVVAFAAVGTEQWPRHKLSCKLQAAGNASGQEARFSARDVASRGRGQNRAEKGREGCAEGRSRQDGWLVYIAKSSIVGRLAEMCRKPGLLMRCLDVAGRGAMLNASRGWKGRRAGLAERCRGCRLVGTEPSSL